MEQEEAESVSIAGHSLQGLRRVLGRREIIWISLGVVLVAYLPHVIYFGQRSGLLTRPAIPGVEIFMKEGWLPMSFPGWLSFSFWRNQGAPAVAYGRIRWYRPWYTDLMIFWSASPPRELDGHATYQPKHYNWGTAYVTQSGETRSLTSDWGYIPQFNLAVIARDAGQLENIASIAKRDK